MFVDGRGVLTMLGRQLLVDRVERSTAGSQPMRPRLWGSPLTAYKIVATVPRRGSGRPCRPLLDAQAAAHIFWTPTRWP
jgi:hypothetical protein